MIELEAARRHSVLDVTEAADGIYWLKLSREGLDFAPGDCVALYGADGGSRPYSIASGVGDDFLLFLIRAFADGKVSPWLCSREVGEKIGVSEPFGWFRPGQTEEGERAVFLATGTGIAPFLAYRRSLPQQPPFKILYGARGLQQAAGRELLDGWCDVLLALSREPQAGYHHGRIGDLLEALPDTPETHYYLCGHAGMIREIGAALDLRGVPIFRVHREVFF
ncbi:MAG: ferredoxin--NADP reductase, partial [Kiritimatiellia bacterium]